MVDIKVIYCDTEIGDRYFLRGEEVLMGSLRPEPEMPKKVQVFYMDSAKISHRHVMFICADSPENREHFKECFGWHAYIVIPHDRFRFTALWELKSIIKEVLEEAHNDKIEVTNVRFGFRGERGWVS